MLTFALNVSNLAASEQFFGTLGFEVAGRRTLSGSALEQLTGLPNTRLQTSEVRLGNETVTLTSFEPRRGKSMNPDAQANDTSFQHVAIVVADVDQALAHAESHLPVARVSSDPQTIPRSNRAAAGVRAVYLRDHEGHFLELIAFPSGKGDPRWHTAGGLFRGIDHSAIAVRDSGRSLTFYRDFLGFRVTKVGLNDEPEQEALSGVPGARVRVTSLAADAGPGIELLEYLSPRDGDPFPEPGAADLAHWETIIEVADLSAVRHLAAAKGTSSSPVDVSAFDLGYALARSCVDPDGHSVRLVERTRDLKKK